MQICSEHAQVQGFQEAIKLCGEMVFKYGSLYISLAMNSGKMNSNRLNALFSPLHNSYVQEQYYKEKGASHY